MELVSKQRDWCLSYFKTNGDAEALKQYNIMWPALPVEIDLTLMVKQVEEPAAVFGAGVFHGGGFAGGGFAGGVGGLLVGVVMVQATVVAT